MESDADAVQILSLHAAKGLQFRVVLVPIEWKKRAKPKRDQPPIFRAKPDDLQRRINVSWLEGKGQAYAFEQATQYRRQPRYLPTAIFSV